MGKQGDFSWCEERKLQYRGSYSLAKGQTCNKPAELENCSRQVEFLWCKGGGETAVCVELVMQIWGKTAVYKRNSCATQGESTGNSRGAKEGNSRGAMGENCAIYTWELLVVQRGKTADCCTQREFLWRKCGKLDDFWVVQRRESTEYSWTSRGANCGMRRKLLRCKIKGENCGKHGEFLWRKWESAVYKGYSCGANGETALCVGNSCGAKGENCCTQAELLRRKWGNCGVKGGTGVLLVVQKTVMRRICFSATGQPC